MHQELVEFAKGLKAVIDVEKEVSELRVIVAIGNLLLVKPRPEDFINELRLQAQRFKQKEGFDAEKKLPQRLLELYNNAIGGQPDSKSDLSVKAQPEKTSLSSTDPAKTTSQPACRGHSAAEQKCIECTRSDCEKEA